MFSHMFCMSTVYHVYNCARNKILDLEIFLNSESVFLQETHLTELMCMDYLLFL